MKRKRQSGAKLAFQLLKENWRSIIAFEALYKLATALIATPLLYGLFNVSIRFSGLTYISNDTIRDYLLDPVSIACLFLLLLLIAFVSLVDMEAVICCYHASYAHTRMSVWEMFYAGFTKARRVFHRRNWLAAGFVLIIIPFTNVAVTSGYISNLEVPEFILDHISANPTLHLLYQLIGAALIVIAFACALSLQAFTLENVNFMEAGKRSVALMKRRYLRTAFGTLLWQIILVLAGLVLLIVLLGVAFGGVRLFFPAYMRYSAASSALFLVSSIVSVLMGILSPPLVFVRLSAAYYIYKTEAGQEISPPEAFNVPRLSGKLRKALAAVLCLAVAGNAAVLVAQRYNEDYAMRNMLMRPEIAAHRGSSVRSPENNIPAFENAMLEGADWIELDVHQTSDGVVVVTHDESIKRIAGVDKKVWELTYAELMEYDVGSWFSPEFSHLRVATLDEALKLCKGKIKLNIELKPTGHEPNFEQNIIDLLRQNDYRRGEYILASQNADALRNIKAIDPDAETLFVMVIAAGNVTDVDFADAFSVEESSIDEALVNRIHAAGKQIFAWTVNREANAEKMIQLRVDCILSDDPVMVRRVMRADAENAQLMIEWIVGAFFTPNDAAAQSEIAQGP